MAPVVLPKLLLACTAMTAMCPRARSPSRAGPATLSHRKGVPDGGCGHPGLRLYRQPGASAGAGAGNDVGLPGEGCALVETLRHVAITPRSCRRWCADDGDELGFCRDRAGQKPKPCISGKEGCLEGWLHLNEWRLETRTVGEDGNL